MQPQNAPPPPPEDPYRFITHPQKPAKKLLPTGNSKTQRLLIVGVGVVILFILISLVYGLISSAGSGSKDDYLSLSQQQVELIRVSEIGLQKANQAEAKSLAVTVKYSVLSQQSSIQKLAKKAGVKLDAKALVGGRNKQTDTALTAAQQNNQFDAVFIKIMNTSLASYRQTLQSAAGNTSQTATITTLNQYADQIQSLLAKPAEVPST